jgi:hypothetical protein
VVQFAGSREAAILVREDDYIVFEHNEEVADLFPVARASLPLVSVNSRVTPQGEEGF